MPVLCVLVQHGKHDVQSKRCIQELFLARRLGSWNLVEVTSKGRDDCDAADPHGTLGEPQEILPHDHSEGTEEETHAETLHEQDGNEILVVLRAHADEDLLQAQ